jgi:putative spermidine/putrescine transport system permease protein
MQAIATDTQITHWQRAWLYLLCCAVLVFLVVPCLLVIPMSFSADSFLHFPPSHLSLRWYRSFLASDDWMHGAWISIEVALATVVLATSVGTAGAYAIHSLGGRFAALIRTAFMLPMIVPVILIAVGVFFAYARLRLNNTVTGLVLAHTLLAIPYVVITVGSGLDTYDMTQEMVARSLGASRIKAFFQVTFPQIAPAIYASLLFSFMTSFDETVIVLFISGGDTSTLTKLMFESIRDQQDPTIAAISTLLISVSAVALILVQRLSRNKSSL